MCEADLEAKYRSLVHGGTLLESSLHTNLAEHINSEIGLGTITNVDSAKNWLHTSFLYQRIRQNPQHYAIGKDGNQTWQERVDEMVLGSIERLKENQLVESSEDDPDSLASTEFGDIMSKVRHQLPCPFHIAHLCVKYYIRQSTVLLSSIYRECLADSNLDESYTQTPRESIPTGDGKTAALLFP